MRFVKTLLVLAVIAFTTAAASWAYMITNAPDDTPPGKFYSTHVRVETEDDNPRMMFVPCIVYRNPASRLGGLSCDWDAKFLDN